MTSFSSVFDDAKNFLGYLKETGYTVGLVGRMPDERVVILPVELLTTPIREAASRHAERLVRLLRLEK